MFFHHPISTRCLARDDIGSPHLHLPETSKNFQMLHVNVLFPSGRTETLSLPESSNVGDLRSFAQKSLKLRHFLQFVSAAGRLLEDPEESLTAALEEGDSVTALAVPLRMAATDQAFALWRCGDEKLVTWGDAGHGGDSSAVSGLSKWLMIFLKFSQWMIKR